MSIRQTFIKSERLHEKKLIQKLFDEGESFYKYPFKVFYLNVKNKDAVKAKVLVSVSKRLFKKAVERNRIKRIIREAYRKNKYLLSDNKFNENGQILLIGFIYTGKKLPEYQETEEKIILILQELVKHE